MDAESVGQLAMHERGLWSGHETLETPAPAPGPGAYVPLGTDLDTAPRGPWRPKVKFVDASALGTVLAFRFRWPPDEHDRELLLLLDFRRYPGDVVGASVWLLEYVEQHIHHDTGWFPRDLVPISDSVAVVRAVRHPGGP